eukprot:4090235-Amphidinium_carterae.1
MIEKLTTMVHNLLEAGDVHPSSAATFRRGASSWWHQKGSKQSLDAHTCAASVSSSKQDLRKVLERAGAMRKE